MSSYKYLNKLQDKRVLIFGGTSGIGFGVAEASIEFGSTVSIAGSKPEKLENATSRLRKAYPDTSEDRISTHLIDLAALDKVEAELEALFKKVTNDGATKLDHVVYTAGDWNNFTSVSNITVSGIQPAFAVRLIVPLLMAKLIPQYLHSSAESSFTLTSGTNTARPEKGWALPAAIGGGTEALVRGLAVDYAPIRVNCVAPGIIATEATSEMISGAPAGLLEATTMTKRIGRVEDVSESYLHSMKDTFITGALIASDGGRLLLGPSFGLSDDFLESEGK